MSLGEGGNQKGCIYKDRKNDVRQEDNRFEESKKKKRFVKHGRRKKLRRSLLLGGEPGRVTEWGT